MFCPFVQKLNGFSTTGVQRLSFTTERKDWVEA